MGNGYEVVQLSDGSAWKIGILSYNYLYAYNSAATICPSTGKLSVNGKTMDVLPVTQLTNSAINGFFDGFNYGNLYTLVNGQVWEQIGADITVNALVSPRVTVFVSPSGGTKMQVEGSSHAPVLVQ